MMPVWSPTLLTPMTSPTSSSLQAQQVRFVTRLSCLLGASTHGKALQGVKRTDHWQSVAAAVSWTGIRLCRSLTILTDVRPLLWLPHSLLDVPEATSVTHTSPTLGTLCIHPSLHLLHATAGEPKAIPWTHVTPIRCGIDAWAQQDVRRGDVVAWPTNLGWMMGPWLLYAALLNGASIALFQVQI